MQKIRRNIRSRIFNDPITMKNDNSAGIPISPLLTDLENKEGKPKKLFGTIFDQYVKLDPDSAAGRRAKEIRDQLAQKVEQQTPSGAPPPASAPPKLQQ